MYRSDLLTHGKDAAYFDIDVTGVKELCLYVDQNIKDGHDMVSWCDTKVILQGDIRLQPELCQALVHYRDLPFQMFRLPESQTFHAAALLSCQAQHCTGSSFLRPV